MEILVIIVGIILVMAYLNLREYLYNPRSRPVITPDDNRVFANREEKGEVRLSESHARALNKSEKIYNSELGFLVRLISKVAHADGDYCELEKAMVNETLNDIAKQITAQSAIYRQDDILAILQDIFNEDQKSEASIQELCEAYNNYTKGQYKRRLKLVEFLLALAWADGNLADNEREIVIDIAAYLEIENADFNRIYDEFADFYAAQKSGFSGDLKECYKILGVSENISDEELKTAYRALVREYHPDILHHKGLDDSIIKTATQKLQDINAAYESIRNSRELKKSA